MNGLGTYHVQQMERISTDFFEEGDGLRAVARRTDTVDDIVSGRFDEEFGGEGGGIAAVAVGGYGRCELFPHSDIDLLLLFSRAREAEARREKIATLLTTLWDSKLRISHSVRDPRECAKLMSDNAELHISLLDTRFVAGDMGFYKEFCRTTLPRFYLREQRSIERMLAETARKRHKTFDHTLYHLEPNVKESPGGLRDYHLACWMAQLENVEDDRIPWSEEHLPRQRGWDIDEAKGFLFAVRCYLHFYYGRDKNQLSYDMQDAITHAGRGAVSVGDRGAADLMRMYFRHTRRMFGLALRLMEESATPFERFADDPSQTEIPPVEPRFHRPPRQGVLPGPASGGVGSRNGSASVRVRGASRRPSGSADGSAHPGQGPAVAGALRRQRSVLAAAAANPAPAACLPGA